MKKDNLPKDMEKVGLFINFNIVYAVRTQLTWTHLRSIMFNHNEYLI